MLWKMVYWWLCDNYRELKIDGDIVSMPNMHHLGMIRFNKYV